MKWDLVCLWAVALALLALAFCPDLPAAETADCVQVFASGPEGPCLPEEEVWVCRDGSVYTAQRKAKAGSCHELFTAERARRMQPSEEKEPEWES